MAFTPQTTVYDFVDVTCALGPIMMDGFGEGEGVSIEHTEAAFTRVVGSDGKVTRSKTSNETGTITITLLQSSATNDQLAALLTADRAAPGGAGIVPFILRDRSGRAHFAAESAWIEGPPMSDYKREASTRAWVIHTSKLKRFEGGN